MNPPISGSCVCGAIRYTVDVPITELRMCHCTNCQKTSGAAGTVNAAIPSAAFHLTQGTLKKFTGIADSGRTLHRYFCGGCGAPIYSQREITPDQMALRVGTLDNPGEMKITTHIWTRSKRPWAYIDPGSKQVPGQPDAPVK